MKTCHELDYRYGYAMSYGTPIRVRRPNRPRYFKLEGVIKIFKGMPNICLLTNLILSILCRGNWKKMCCIGSIQVLIQVDKNDKWDYFKNRPQIYFFFSFMFWFWFIFLSMKPMSGVAPGLLVIQIQIQAVCLTTYPP